jgi:hypothetical protein
VYRAEAVSPKRQRREGGPPLPTEIPAIGTLLLDREILRTKQHDLKNRSDFALARAMPVWRACMALKNESSTSFEVAPIPRATMSG